MEASYFLPGSSEQFVEVKEQLIQTVVECQRVKGQAYEYGYMSDFEKVVSDFFVSFFVFIHVVVRK